MVFVRIVSSQDLKNCVSLPLVWENPDAMAYGHLIFRYLDVRRFRSLPSRGHGSRVMYFASALATVYRAWWMRQDVWGTVKKHTKERMEISVLHGNLKTESISSLTKFTIDVEPGRYSNN